MKVKAIVFVFCVIAIGELAGRPLPSYIKPCKRNDPNINECLKKMIENLRPFTSRGIPEMHILPLDPMSVPSVTLNQGTNSMNFKAVFTDLKGYGAKNFQVQRIKVNLKNQSLEMDLTLPVFKIESKYSVNGKILMVPIEGNGPFSGNFTNVQAKVKFSLKVVEKKNGKPFIEIKDKKVNLEFGSVRLHFSNLFNGNKEMGDSTNRFINENWKDLMAETRPLIEDTVASIIIGIFKPVFQTYSMDDLFPL